jgi:Zn-dependent protease
MFKSWRLGRMFGFPVEVNLSFLLLLAVVFIAVGRGSIALGLGAVAIVLLAFASVLLHELGHALVARRLGVHVSGIELSFFGGAAKMMQMPRSADHEIAIAAAGPAVSLMLGGAGFGLGAAFHVPLLLTIGWINIVIAAFNLIPALPMDGGRILRALLSRKFDFVRATDIAVTVSRVAAVSFVVFGLLYGYLQLIILAPFLWMMGTRERLLARAMADDYAGPSRGGVEVFRRGGGPFDDRDPYDRWGRWFDRDARSSEPRSEPYARRFEIRQVGGRTVIVPLD